MPAAAVIPAPVAYTIVAAVKKLVVESHDRNGGPSTVLTIVLWYSSFWLDPRRMCHATRWLTVRLWCVIFCRFARDAPIVGCLE